MSTTAFTRRDLLASAMALPVAIQVIDPQSMRVLDEAPSSLHARFRTRVALLRRARIEYVAASDAWRAVSPAGWPPGPVPANYAPRGSLEESPKRDFWYVSEGITWHWYAGTDAFYQLALSSRDPNIACIEDPTLTERDRVACAFAKAKGAALVEATQAVEEVARELLTDVLDSLHALVVDGQALVFTRTGPHDCWRLLNSVLADMTVIR